MHVLIVVKGMWYVEKFIAELMDAFVHYMTICPAQALCRKKRYHLMKIKHRVAVKKTLFHLKEVKDAVS